MEYVDCSSKITSGSADFVITNVRAYKNGNHCIITVIGNSKNDLSSETPFFKVPQEFVPNVRKYINGVISIANTNVSHNVFLQPNGYIYQNVMTAIAKNSNVSFSIDLFI